MDRNRKGSSLVLALLMLVSMAARESNGSFLAKFRKMVEDHGPIINHHKTLQVSPSPAPSPAIDGLSIMNCTNSLKTCELKTQINISACLISSPNDITEWFLLVQNNGESPLEVNVTTITKSRKIPIAQGGFKKVNVTDGRSSPIVLNAGTEACEIRFGPNTNFFRKLPYYLGSSATPLNGVVLLLVGALIIGCTWACCVLGKKKRHFEGAPYKELEMGCSDSPAGGKTETSELWDRSWDEDGWENSWDD